VKLSIGNNAERSRGSAVLVMIVLLALMLIFVFANLRTLHFMDRELKLIEKRQVLRLNSTSAEPASSAAASTNAVPARELEPGSPQAPEQ
jgi:hypothetical protein